ncbi:hypothetical protein LH464_21470 [Neorhizobium sp. T786]|uniref:hypothetical protein n=1 Tax=Pseudorhizobium xiangyangii TaxID=2883104 RepID=UPI001CFF56EE|nr:hypothetical protein [Neorhizobium xiangyangii]MCB5205039.1 hypothetical protein [Neorhizobium xiangyangii]
MTKQPDITENDIRQALIVRATAYAAKAKTSFSAMSISAVNDSKFLSRVENKDLGFNIKTYQRMVEWLDEAERKLRVEEAA